MTCTFAGHRPHRLPWGRNEEDPRCVALKQQLEQTLREVYALGCSHFLCGMAPGSDWYFCEAVRQLREEDPAVTLEAVIPCADQPDRWPEEERTRYYLLLASCDTRRVLEGRYSAGCMLRRNRWMVDHADCMITVYSGHGGGTGAAVRYAAERGCRLFPLWE